MSEWTPNKPLHPPLTEAEKEALRAFAVAFDRGTQKETFDGLVSVVRAVRTAERERVLREAESLARQRALVECLPCCTAACEDVAASIAALRVQEVTSE